MLPTRLPSRRKPFVPASQRGIILITSLIMIVMITLVVLTSLSLSLASIGVTKNVDGSLTAKAAAQAAIESVISDPGFISNPSAVALNALPIDSNSDGVSDYSVTMAAACVGARPVANSELTTSSADANCRAGDGVANSGIEVASGTIAGNSLCTDTRWNISATATRSNSGDRAVVNQGVAVRVPVDEAATSCG